MTSKSAIEWEHQNSYLGVDAAVAQMVNDIKEHVAVHGIKMQHDKSMGDKAVTQFLIAILDADKAGIDLGQEVAKRIK